MPTSTTESAPRARRFGNRAVRIQGFTLVEVLVVVVIIALLATLVSVNLLPDPRQSLRDEAMRLAALLGHAREEAITTGAPLAWQPVDGGYRFLQRATDRTWQSVNTDASLRARALPGGVSFAGIDTAASGNGREPLIILSPTGVADPFRITLALGERRVQVVSDGIGAPFMQDLGR